MKRKGIPVVGAALAIVGAVLWLRIGDEGAVAAGLSDYRCNWRWRLSLIGGEEPALEGDGEGVESGLPSVIHRWAPLPVGSSDLTTR